MHIWVMVAVMCLVPLAGCVSDRPPHLRALDAWIEDLEGRLAEYDATCSTDGPFARTYLVTQYEIRKRVEEGGFYDDDERVARWALRFADYYIAAHDHREDAPLAWQEAWAWGASNRSTVVEDLFVGMNAHIQHDLALAAVDAGIIAAGAQADFDRIEDIFYAVVRNTTAELAQRYSPWLTPTYLNEWTEPLVLRFIVTQWRENAWMYGSRIQNATIPEQREAIRAEMDAAAVDSVQWMQIPKPETRERRVAYCMEYQAEASADLGRDGPPRPSWYTPPSAP